MKHKTDNRPENGGQIAGRLAEEIRQEPRQPRETQQPEQKSRQEHVLLCLSSSSANARIIQRAARMAEAFQGQLTALFVETPEFQNIGEEALAQLRRNMQLAQQMNAKIETVYGIDVAYQIAEFSRLAGVTKIVIGHSSGIRRGMFGQPTLAEKLMMHMPELDIYMIPDNAGRDSVYRARKVHSTFSLSSVLWDLVKSVGILTAVSCIGFLFESLGFAEANIITIYVLGVLVISVITSNRAFGLVSSAVSVLVFNFLFTVPKGTLHAYGQGYPVTFIVMFLAALLTGTLATRLKNNARLAAQAAFRSKVLFDTNQMLQQAKSRDKIFSATARQLTKLLSRDLVVYPVENGSLAEPRIFMAQEEAFSRAEYLESGERAAAQHALNSALHAGSDGQTVCGPRLRYVVIRILDRVYGVLGIGLSQLPMDAFEHSTLQSILGECALALENEQNAREKEEAAILAKNEQLRANLLRSISHDLRTPLTSISGNASNLISNGSLFDDETKLQLYTDIYDDSMWLISLVENLLSVTRLEEGRLNVNVTDDLLEDVITEALRHISRKSVEHTIEVNNAEDFLLVRMDARLIVQVLINIVDNAIKYTPEGSRITISTRRERDMAVVTIADDGPGIPEEAKPHVFDMFYSGTKEIADSRRSLGLGLALCKSIIAAHGGKIFVSDNTPHGAVFTFTLPVGEVILHE